MFNWLFGRNKRVETPCEKKIREVKEAFEAEKKKKHDQEIENTFNQVKEKIISQIPEEIRECVQFYADEQDGMPVISAPGHRYIYTQYGARNRIFFMVHYKWTRFYSSFMEALMEAKKIIVKEER